MSIFHVLPVADLVVGAVYGAWLGSFFGLAIGAVGGVVGAILGFVPGSMSLILATLVFQHQYSKKSLEELRQMLRDPMCLAPNIVLLELRSRGEDLERELPVVFDMLTDPNQSVA